MIKFSNLALLVSSFWLISFAPATAADDAGIGFLLGLTADYLVYNNQFEHVRDDRWRRRGHRVQTYNSYNDSRRHDRNFGYSNREFRQPHRVDHGHRSYTSQPMRGGSSRRTRIIENPYSDRIVTGITLTGIDNDFVHVKDVVSYPGRYLLSPLRYTLSRHLPERYINTGHYIDYISVAAKRKEYFTVTFHYE